MIERAYNIGRHFQRASSHASSMRPTNASETLFSSIVFIVALLLLGSCVMSIGE